MYLSIIITRNSSLVMLSIKKPLHTRQLYYFNSYIDIPFNILSMKMKRLSRIHMESFMKKLPQGPFIKLLCIPITCSNVISEILKNVNIQKKKKKY